ncbi:PilN domain-containing protein [Rheinheimera sp. MMS21-TC3]|uniref:PilN domain-containing protein n=1 Tax=Rheinheimera sp. MMS21-TC3 TaxID=3072790 RepID=UPI0028C472CA|nr:PilN domain-containing protein [Rheinheimera sp. MMS21-TC3]WNO61659.1 PilN domain-containing protein [Rheinheimera sp. MMS21-TC3]
MKALSKMFTRPRQLKGENSKNSKFLSASQRIRVLPKQQYTEFQRSYKAALTDLPKLIRNELKVLASSGSKAIWKVQSNENGRYQVLYALLPAKVIADIPNGWHILIPETWLLYRLLVKKKLYKVQAKTPYWAWLADSNQLHLTPIQGLMVNQSYFLDALGENSKGINPELLTLPSSLQMQTLPLKWWELVGCIVRTSTKQVKQAIDYKKIGGYSAALVAIYMMFISAGLTWQENRLQVRVKQLQAEASALFDKQQALDHKAETIQTYRDLYKRLPSASMILHTLSTQLADDAILDNIQQSGSLLQIRGTSPSAVDVISKLSGRPEWAEVKFDRSIQSNNKGGETFTISLVYQPKATQVTSEKTTQSMQQEVNNEK